MILSSILLCVYSSIEHVFLFFFYSSFLVSTDVGHSEAVGGRESAHSNGGTQPSVEGAIERASRFHWFPIETSLFRYFTAGQEQRWIEIWCWWKYFTTFIGWIGGRFNINSGNITKRIGTGSRQSHFSIVHHYSCCDVVIFDQRRCIEFLRWKTRSWLTIVTSSIESRSRIIAKFTSLSIDHDDDDGQLWHVT